MTEKYDVDDFVPHSGKMSLLTKIIDFGDGWLESEVTISEDSTFSDTKGVSAEVGIEYLAQSIAAYAGSQERAQGNPPKLGFLLGTRRYETSVDYFPLGSVLKIKVVLEMEAENGLNVFNGTIKGADTNLNIEVVAKLNVFQPEDAKAFLEGA
ncbi:hypothetical protein [Agaribacter marinus]|uniref:3-hydroxylacyl-ACP dehydratase n=1 Tax=Agaribacter marinus TaxID=1431249 RepID=A0AA37SYC4_9ALTE|nr:hypothetical protein [Agaribacter marinus]GLR70739.1 3-hydroxylacyl-ACP dehydratase [Agaribacter marinus]